MRTVIETPTFQKQADKIWAESERFEFIDWIAANPLAGDVIPGADGARKVRWGRAGSGKRGGVRVVYFNPDGSLEPNQFLPPCRGGERSEGALGWG
jgi:hypothetical protein